MELKMGCFGPVFALILTLTAPCFAWRTFIALHGVKMYFDLDVHSQGCEFPALPLAACVRSFEQHVRPHPGVPWDRPISIESRGTGAQQRPLVNITRCVQNILRRYRPQRPQHTPRPLPALVPHDFHPEGGARASFYIELYKQIVDTRTFNFLDCKWGQDCIFKRFNAPSYCGNHTTKTPPGVSEKTPLPEVPVAPEHTPTRWPTHWSDTLTTTTERPRNTTVTRTDQLSAKRRPDTGLIVAVAILSALSLLLLIVTVVLVTRLRRTEAILEQEKRKQEGRNTPPTASCLKMTKKINHVYDSIWSGEGGRSLQPPRSASTGNSPNLNNSASGEAADDPPADDYAQIEAGHNMAAGASKMAPDTDKMADDPYDNVRNPDSKMAANPDSKMAAVASVDDGYSDLVLYADPKRDYQKLGHDEKVGQAGEQVTCDYALRVEDNDAYM